MGARTHFAVSVIAAIVGVVLLETVANRRWRVLVLRSTPRIVFRAGQFFFFFRAGGLSYRCESAVLQPNDVMYVISQIQTL